MRSFTRLFALGAVLALPATAPAMGNGHGKPQPIPCPPDVASAVATQCPCAGTTNPYFAPTKAGVEDAGGELGIEALWTGVPDGNTVNQIAQFEQCDQFVQRMPILIARNIINCAVEGKRVQRGNIPGQLVAVPHNQRNLAQESSLTAGGCITHHLRRAGYNAGFTSLEDGVTRYVTQFLNTADCYR